MGWSGVFPALTTKMGGDGSLDLDWTQKSADRLIKAGVSGLIVLPMLGETAALSASERESIVRGVAEVVNGRVPMLSGLIASETAQAKQMAVSLKDWGADGYMVFPSLGYKTDPRETAQWYRNIAAATDRPIMIYNNPITYGVDVTPEVLADLADIPEIVCIKEETGDVRRVTDLFVEFGDRFSIFCGVDDQILESVSLGSTGWVSGMTNVWPDHCVELFNLCRATDLDRARHLYRLLTPPFHLDTHVKLVQYIKLAEHLEYGAPEWVRPPRLPLEGAEREMVRSIIETAKSNLT